MSAINFHTKEISVKIVYYGPGLCGKTTSLQSIYKELPEERRNQFVSLATEVDRTIFFDFLPVAAYKILDMTVRLQLYTVPGQVFYNATRKLVLNGVDGLVFVADSQRAMRDSNLESLENLSENLADLGMEVDLVPMVIQANKRDLDEIFTIQEMDELYNPRKVPLFATIATSGEGLLPAVKTVSQLVMNSLVRKGLGEQIRADNRTLSRRRKNPTDTISGQVTRLAEAEAETQAAPRPSTAKPPPTAETGMWPRAVEQMGRAVEAAIAAGQWTDAVRAAHDLITAQAHQWAADELGNGEDPGPRYLLMRGVNRARYQTFVDATHAVKRGETLSQDDAVVALIVALQAVW